MCVDDEGLAGRARPESPLSDVVADEQAGVRFRNAAGTHACAFSCCDIRVTADQLAAALDLDVYEVGICHACLSFVSFPLDDGDERETARAIRRFAPILWEEGLALLLQASLERSRRRRVAAAEAAIADIERQLKLDR